MIPALSGSSYFLTNDMTSSHLKTKAFLLLGKVPNIVKLDDNSVGSSSSPCLTLSLFFTRLKTQTDRQTVHWPEQEFSDEQLHNFIMYFPYLSFLAIFASITKTSPCNEDPLTPHFYIVKLGFTGVFIIFLFLL